MKNCKLKKYEPELEEEDVVVRQSAVKSFMHFIAITEASLTKDIQCLKDPAMVLFKHFLWIFLRSAAAKDALQELTSAEGKLQHPASFLMH